jgi:hypothetical protein
MIEHAKVVNIRKEKCDVYIGRPSIFGNPFEIGKDGTREEVINKFYSYFYHRLYHDMEFVNKVKELQGKKLGCFCAPLPCHGDIIVKFLDQLIKIEEMKNDN